MIFIYLYFRYKNMNLVSLNTEWLTIPVQAGQHDNGFVMRSAII